MRLKELQSFLQGVEVFENPQISLEQYATSPHIAAHMLYAIDNDFSDIQGNVVADFGCGCGVLTIGSAILSAGLVLGLDIDDGALEIGRRNAEEMEIDTIQFLQCDILHAKPFQRDVVVDTVIMNPPFGTKNNKGVDMQFVEQALKICNGSVYSLHKSSTRDYILKKCKEWNSKGEVIARLKFDLPNTYRFHKKHSVDVDVDLIRFTH